MIDGSSRERNMREPDVQQLDTELPHLKSKTREEGSECVEEPSRALQLSHVQRCIASQEIGSSNFLVKIA